MKDCEATAMSLTYVLLDFPIASEQFLVREVKALRALGVPIQILTVRSGPNPNPVPAGCDVSVWRPPPSWSWCVWRESLLAALCQPEKAAGLIGLAWSLGGDRGMRGRMGAVRFALVALYYARVLADFPPKIVHAHFASAPTTLGLLVADWFRCSFGFSVHASDLYAEGINFPPRVRRASHVLACSEIAASDIRKRLPRHLHARVHTVHHGVDVAALKHRAPIVAADAEPLILAVGRFEPKKGFAHLVEACALLRQSGLRFSCELIGAGTGQEGLLQQIRKRGLERQLRLLTWCPPSELTHHYLRATVLAVPSVIAPDGNRDNIPNVVLEALGHGVPVVASALPALQDVLEGRAAALLVPPGDAQALADALLRVCSDPGLARQLGERGRRLVAQHFDLQTNARRLHDLLARS